jgi:hypothetical protein
VTGFTFAEKSCKSKVYGYTSTCCTTIDNAELLPLLYSIEVAEFLEDASTSYILKNLISVNLILPNFSLA